MENMAFVFGSLGMMGFFVGAAAMSQVNQLRKEFEEFRDSAHDDPPSPPI